MDRYQNCGKKALAVKPLVTAPPEKPSVSTPSVPMLRRSQRNSAAKKTDLLPMTSDITRSSTHHYVTRKTSAKSSTPSSTDEPWSLDLIKETANNLNFDDTDFDKGQEDEDDVMTPNHVTRPPRIPPWSNISEVEIIGDDDGGIQNACCAMELCIRKEVPVNASDAGVVICMECTKKCHVDCAQDFYFQKPSKEGRLPLTVFSIAARQQCRAASKNGNVGSTYYCLLCESRIKSARQLKKNPMALTKNVAPKKRPNVQTILRAYEWSYVGLFPFIVAVWFLMDGRLLQMIAKQMRQSIFTVIRKTTKWVC